VSAPSWEAFYYAGWQFPFAVMIVPFAFLLYRAIVRERTESALEPAFAPFVSLWVTGFTAETLLDPVATGPIATALDGALAARGLGAGLASPVFATLFVVLGDFRAFWLVFHLSAPERATRSALAAFAVSLVAPTLAGLVSLRDGPPQAMWLTHELVSLALVFAIAHLALPDELAQRRRSTFARKLLGYVAAYYGLWAAADVLILSGADVGWAVRLVPNQLYYGLFVPFVWRSFFAPGAELR
jgi:hypothetical protein